MTKQSQILRLISAIRNSHPEMIRIFTCGSCFHLFKILRTVYPGSEPYSNIEHIITKIDNKFYDINGQVLNTKDYVPWIGLYTKKSRARSFRNLTKNEPFGK